MACAAYSACSVTMILVNKAIASYGVQSGGVGSDPAWTRITVLPVVFQSMCAVALIQAMRMAGLMKFEWPEARAASKTIPLACSFVAMLFTGFMSLRTVTVPMVTVFKNITNVVIVAGEWTIYGESVPWGVMVAIQLMLFGALFAAMNDLSFSLQGCVWIAMNCLSTASYVLFMREVTRTVGLSKFAAVAFNNGICCILLLLLSAFSGELGDALAYRSPHPSPDSLPSHTLGVDVTFVLLNTITGVTGFCLNFAQLWCVAETSATTYAVIGSLNKIPVALLGSLLFKSHLTLQGFIFILINIGGGLSYSFAQIRAKIQIQQKAEAASVPNLCPSPSTFMDKCAHER